MNAHDSERIKGLLEALGYREARAPRGADLILFNTCTIREKRRQPLPRPPRRGQRRSADHPERDRGVGGCWAQAVKEEVFARSRSSTSRSGPADCTTRRLARPATRSPRRASSSSRGSPAACPPSGPGTSRRGCRSAWAATPSARTASSPPTRGRERSRPPGSWCAEVERARRRRRPRGHAARPERQLLRPRSRRREPGRRSASSSRLSTPSMGSSGSASRARTRRTCAST